MFLHFVEVYKIKVKKRKLMLLQLSLSNTVCLNMSECGNENRILNMPRVLNMGKCLWENSGYDWVLNMRKLHSVLNRPKYALAEF